jgi:hypothetical protein
MEYLVLILSFMLFYTLYKLYEYSERLDRLEQKGAAVITDLYSKYQQKQQIINKDNSHVKTETTQG